MKEQLEQELQSINAEITGLYQDLSDNREQDRTGAVTYEALRTMYSLRNNVRGELKHIALDEQTKTERKE